jgi:chitinase
MLDRSLVSYPAISLIIILLTRLDFTGHQANLYPSKSDPNATPFSTDQAVSDYIKAGVPSNKIVLGMPLYGRSFDNTNGLGQTYSGVGQGSWEAGVWDYKVLPISPAVEEYDSEAGASYSWDATNKIIVSYDNKAMTQTKSKYIVSKGLGGGMWWEASGDRLNGDSLMGVAFGALKAAGGIEQVQNTLSYPGSQYANMVAGMSS